MASLRAKKNSAFLAFQKLDMDSDGSDHERAQQEQRDKQKQKKKAKKKKTSSEDSSLKELAMCPGMGKKNKGTKGKSMVTAPQPEPTRPLSPTERIAKVVEKITAPEPAPPTARATSKPSSPTNIAPSNSPAVPPAAATAALNTKVSAKATKPPPSTQKTAPSSKSSPQSPRKQASAPPPAVPTPSAKPPHQPPTQQAQATSSSGDLGAIYSPTHITVTRADGQVSRQIAVAEMMDQLVRFQQVNAQLTMANRTLQEQRQRDAGILTALQNEVAMFRQMCLNLQAEVTQLRTGGGPGAYAPQHQQQPPAAPMMNGQASYSRSGRPTPPPGMS